MTDSFDETNRTFWEEHQRWCAYMATKGFQCLSAEAFAARAFEISDGVCRFKEGGQKDVDHHLHACMLPCGEKYFSIGQILLAYLRYVIDLESKSSIKDMISSQIDALKDPLCQEKDEQIYRCAIAQAKELIFLSSCGRKLIEEIRKKALAPYGVNTDLEVWLGELFPDQIRVSDKTSLDGLDRLSLIITLFMANEVSEEELKQNYEDFKAYDIKIAKSMIRTIYQQQILDKCERVYLLNRKKRKKGMKELNGAVVEFVNQYKKDQIQLEKGKCEKKDGSSGEVQYYLISQSENFNVFLFDDVSFLDFACGRYTYEYSDGSNHKYLLAILPRGVKVKIGKVQNGKLFVVWNPVAPKGKKTTEKNEAKRVAEKREIKFFEK